jgi:hypothetical protein
MIVNELKLKIIGKLSFKFDKGLVDLDFLIFNKENLFRLHIKKHSFIWNNFYLNIMLMQMHQILNKLTVV